MNEKLLSDSVSSILLKGDPGCGKSSLAVELLKAGGKGVLVSTRTAPEKAVLQNPTIHVTVDGSGQKEVFINQTQVHVEDYQLSNPANILTVVLSKVAEHKGELVVLDSWDAIAKEMDPVERLKAEKTMIAAAQTGGARLVFISEEPTLTTTDYLVDAIVELRMQLLNGSIVRSMFVRKLRGAAIDRPESLFTLADGVFRECRPTVIQELSGANGRLSTIKDSGDLYSTGVSDLDRILGGGFRPGHTVVLEWKRDFPAFILSPLTQIISANRMMNGAGYVHLPPIGDAPEEICARMERLIPKRVVDSKLRVGYYGTSDDPRLIPLSQTLIEDSFSVVWKSMDALDATSDKPSSLVIGIDKLEAIHGPIKLQKFLAMTIERVKRSKGTATFVIRENAANKDSIVSMCDSHVTFDLKEGAILSQVIKPFRSTSTIEYDYSKGYPEAHFVPIS